tara:strand:- start:487 stop:1437 length:951 start_codon:yes stop_codon:yes gene_type:complete
MQLKKFFKKKGKESPLNSPDNTDLPDLENSKTDTIEKVIKELEIFQRLNSKQIKLLSTLVIPRSCPKGEIVIKKGSVGLGMFIITSGRMEVYEEQDGNHVRLAIIKASEYVGEMSLIDKTPRSANVKALDDCEYQLLTRDSFNGLVKREPEILWGIVPILVKRLQNTSKDVIDLSKSTSKHQGATERVVSDSATDNTDGQDTDGKETPEKITNVDSSQEGEQEMNTEGDSKENMVSSIMQLSAASLMCITSIPLLSSQELIRLAIGKGSLNRRISKSEDIMSSTTTSMKDNMDEKNQKLHDSFWDFMASLTSILKK